MIVVRFSKQMYMYPYIRTQKHIHRYDGLFTGGKYSMLQRLLFVAIHTTAAITALKISQVILLKQHENGRQRVL